MGKIEALTGVKRRRRWSFQEKSKILAEAFAPGATVAEVARRHEISPQQIYTWRRKSRSRQTVSEPDVPPRFIEFPVCDSPIYRPSEDAVSDTRRTNF